MELTAVIYLFGRYFNLRGWIDDQLVVDKLFCDVLQLLLQRWLLRRERKAQRQRAIVETLKAEKEYRQTVLDKLTGLGSRMTTMDDSIADLQRDNIERAYCMFKLEHGYCPSGMKESIASMYSSYQARGYNHIASSRIEELLALPEFPEK